jgi:hypothetical protein
VAADPSYDHVVCIEKGEGPVPNLKFSFPKDEFDGEGKLLRQPMGEILNHYHDVIKRGGESTFTARTKPSCPALPEVGSPSRQLLTTGPGAVRAASWLLLAATADVVGCAVDLGAPLAAVSEGAEGGIPYSSLLAGSTGRTGSQPCGELMGLRCMVANLVSAQ